MGRPATLKINIISDASRAGQGFDKTAQRVAKFESGINRASVAAASVVGGLAVIGKAAFDSASALEQSAGAVESVFGRQAAAVKELASAAADSVGLASSEYQQLAAVLGSQLGNLGVAQDQVVGTTDDLITRASDLAATFGGSTSDAVQALSALFRGEADPIEQYGVSIKQADVNARLAAQGLDHLEGPARQQAETQARLALLTEQTAAAQGAFAREADTAAGAQQRLAAKFENTKAQLGQALLPLVTQLADKLAVAAEWAARNGDTLQAVAIAAGVVAGAVLAVNAAYRVYVALSLLVRGTAAAWTLVATAAKTGAISTGLFWARVLALYIAAVLRDTALAVAAWARAGAAAALAAARAAAAWVASSARTVAALALQGAAFLAQRAIMIAGAATTAVMTAAQWALNAAMSANPIGIVIVAVAALVAIIIVAYQRSETFRSIVQAVGRAAAAAFGWVVDRVRDVISWVGNAISTISGMSVVKSYIRGVQNAFDAMMGPIRSIIGLVQSLINWISRISFPSPPAWVSGLFGSAASPTVLGVPRTDQLFRFLPPATLNAAAAMPSITAASADAGQLMALASMRPGTTTVNNYRYEITIDGALDPVAVGGQIEDVVRRSQRGTGGSVAIRLA